MIKEQVTIANSINIDSLKQFTNVYEYLLQLDPVPCGCPLTGA